MASHSMITLSRELIFFLQKKCIFTWDFSFVVWWRYNKAADWWVLLGRLKNNPNKKKMYHCGKELMGYLMEFVTTHVPPHTYLSQRLFICMSYQIKKANATKKDKRLFMRGDKWGYVYALFVKKITTWKKFVLINFPFFDSSVFFVSPRILNRINRIHWVIPKNCETWVHKLEN